MRIPTIACTLLSVCLTSFQLSGAAVPPLVNYSGVLTNGGGVPQVGTFSVTFRIYEVPSGATPAIWTETQNITTDAAGLFSVLLGSVTTLTTAKFAGSERYLGITISGDSEMSPRTRITTAPYAFRVGTIDSAAGGLVIGSLMCGYIQSATGGDNFLAGNDNAASGYAASVTGGTENTASGSKSLVGCGILNQATGTACVVGGGNSNIAGGNSSVVGGGYLNRVIGDFSAILGGHSNQVDGDYSFAGGHNAKAGDICSFVWNGDTLFYPGDSLRADGMGSVTFRAPGGYRIFTGPGVFGIGARLAPGSGSWSSMSDRDSKENFALVEPDEILNRLSVIPINKWNYITQGDEIRHIGPMAQDFYAAFGVGEDDKHISAIDADGVALAAIQALNLKLGEQLTKQATENEDLRNQIAELREMIRAQVQK